MSSAALDDWRVPSRSLCGLAKQHQIRALPGAIDGQVLSGDDRESSPRRERRLTGAPLASGSDVSSTSVFQAPQPSQRPLHLGWTLPQL